ncbi:unnamed protein product [Durusdinium trenchii]|uniref:Transmembrane protein n=1 Tax=Durusdinium trenchii TaxID=1381693 RepID=A0ABP0MXR3_9DINO
MVSAAMKDASQVSPLGLFNVWCDSTACGCAASPPVPAETISAPETISVPETAEGHKALGEALGGVSEGDSAVFSSSPANEDRTPVAVFSLKYGDHLPEARRESLSSSMTATDSIQLVLSLVGKETVRLQPLILVILSGLASALIAGLFSALSLAISGIWAVPGHSQANSLDGFLNRLGWSLSPFFLGSYFPCLFVPEMMTDWRMHIFFLAVSLTPFVIADVAFPYVVGTDTDFKIWFSTSFWPTTTCVFFLPCMIAGIRHNKGDPFWYDLRSHVKYIRTQGKGFWADLLRLNACFWATVVPVNYLALDFAMVLPHLDQRTAALVRPLISLVIKVGCFEIFKVAAKGLGDAMQLFGFFPLALNIGLHTAMSAVLCKDWLSVLVWILCDFATCIWRTQRVRVRQVECLLPIFPCLNESDEKIRRRGLESIILGWGLTAALSSILVVYPFTFLLPDMLQGLMFPKGTTSLIYLAVVSACDILFDIGAIVLLTHSCRYDFGRVLGYQPFSKTLRYAYLSVLTVVWAPFAVGMFGWVFHHMCVAAFDFEAAHCLVA